MTGKAAGRTPVIVGVGQVTQRAPDPAHALEPVDLMAEAATQAGRECAAAMLSRLDLVAVPQPVSWRHYSDAGALLAERLGVTPGGTVRGTLGGNTAQLLVNHVAAEIAAGRAGIALVAGGEAMRTRLAARRAGLRLDWTSAPVGSGPTVVGDDRPGATPTEQALGVTAPLQVFPLFETAVRAARGRSVAEHQTAIAGLWAHFSAVAAANPHAWYPDGFTAAEIRRPGPGNRMVVFPYTKRMAAYDRVDQAAAVIMCSLDAARAAGVPDDQIVFLHGGADGADRPYLSERPSMTRAAGLAAVAGGALRAAGLDTDDVARFDLYSCFPSAVEIAMDELGLAGPDEGDPRPLTVTGGLSFFGGPPNTYTLHAIASMAEACRADPGSAGLVTGLGWYFAKHSAAVYSTRPPAHGFRTADPAVIAAAVEAASARTPVGAYSGPATIEATAVTYEGGTPARALASCLVPAGGRTFATTDDADVCRAMTEQPWEGRSATIAAAGAINRLVG